MQQLRSLLVLVLLVLASCSGSSGSGRKIGVDSSWYPLQFDSKESAITAFSTELLTKIGSMENIPFVKVNVNWNDLMEGLQKNKYEAILTSMPPYIFNEKLFDFSDVYLPLGPVLVVGINSTIHSIDTLNGKEIAVITGSKSDLLLEGSSGVLIRYYDSIPVAMNATVAGTVDGAVIDILSAVAYCRDLYQGQLKIVTAPLTEEGLRLVTKHDAAPDLIKGFNAGLKKLEGNGTYAKLLDKWNLQESVPR